MEAASRRQALATEGRRLLDVAASAPDAAVAPCPGWDVRRLVVHIAGVWRAIASWAGGSETAPADEDPWADAEQALEGLLDAFAQSSDASPALLRRAHLETLVHRIDAEVAAGQRSPIDPEFALDGIDELYSVLVPLSEPVLPNGSFHLHRTDGDGEFMLTAGDDGIVVTHDHGKGDAALRASAEDLFLVVWGRRPLDDLELFGDPEIAAQWIRLAP